MTDMAEVLRAHWSTSTHTDRKPFVDKCDGCGKVLHAWGDQIPEVHPLAAHQAAALSAAGYGLVADAKREALEEAADHLMRVGWNNACTAHLRARAAEMRHP